MFKKIIISLAVFSVLVLPFSTFAGCEDDTDTIITGVTIGSCATNTNLMTGIASTALAFMSDVISNYWTWILGLVVLVALAHRFKRLVGLSR